MIREVKASDYPAIAKVMMRAFANPPWNEDWDYSRAYQRIEQLDDGKYTRCYVYEENEKIIGVLCGKLITYVNDLELMNPETLAHVLNAQDLLRSVLILADEETTQAIISTIEDILKSAKETNLSINIRLICQILEEVIKRIPEDKTIPQIVSFGRI